MLNLFRNKGAQQPEGADGNASSTASAAASGPTTFDVLAAFKNTPLPDAIDGLLFRASMAAPGDPSVSGFERYAARLLTEAGAAGIRSIAVERPIDVRHLSSTNLYWFSFDTRDLTSEQRALILGVESALNRLMFVARALKNDAGWTQASACSEETCAESDWKTMRLIGSDAPSFVAKSEEPNNMLTLHGATGTRGGNWDVSTRFASLLESLALPYRLEYRLDCDVSAGAGGAGTLVARITLPTPAQMPRSRWLRATGQWQDCTAQQPSAAAAYALRLATLVAGIAFGTSVGITRVIVHGCENSLDAPTVLSLEFSRMSFMMEVVPALKNGATSTEAVECDPATLFSIVKPARWAIMPDATGHNQPVDPLDAGLGAHRTPLAQDTRPLPPELANLLHADMACDLDVMSTQDAALSDRLKGAMADRDDSPLLAIAQLEDLVEKGSAADEADAGEGTDAGGTGATAGGGVGAGVAGAGKQPTLLYCEGPFARLLVDLVNDDPTVRYRRASDVAQSARAALSTLYLDLGDNAGALVQAEKCLKAAPSSPSAYQDLITAHVAAGRYDLVVDVAKQALRYLVLDDGIYYLYYRLAYAFWKTGRLDEAVACYGRVPRTSSMGESAARELSELLSEMGGREPMEGAEATATLRAAGVPLAPTDEAVELLAKALVGLCDAGMPLAAAPAASLLGHIKRNDALSALASSLKEGV